MSKKTELQRKRLRSKRFLDLSGKRFGKLLVESIAYTDEGYKTHWNCLCDCGNRSVVSTSNLTTGHTTSCGCVFREKASDRLVKHSQTNTRLYRTWCNMKNRCYNPNVDSYRYYGKRGIKVCEEWTNSFESFMDWALENGYTDDLMIERIDSDDDYKPSNCRWCDSFEQANNKRSNHTLTYNGQTKTLAQWAREQRLSYSVLHRRISLGWDVERALNTPKSADKWHKS